MAVAEWRLVCLPHPKDGQTARFLWRDEQFYEVQRSYRAPSSWFIDEYVEQDGSLYVASKVDPLYLVLPLLKAKRREGDKGPEHEGYFCSLADVLAETSHPQLRLVAKCAGMPDQLQHVCEVKQGWDEPVYRLHDERLLQWLRAKTERVVTAIFGKTKLAPLGVDGADPSSESEVKRRATVLKMALGFVSEYLSEELFDTLCSSYGLSSKEIFAVPKPKNDEEDGDGDEEMADPGKKKDTPSKAKKRKSAASKQLEKAAKGTKSIKSFFSSFAYKKKPGASDKKKKKKKPE